MSLTDTEAKSACALHHGKARRRPKLPGRSSPGHSDAPLKQRIGGLAATRSPRTGLPDPRPLGPTQHAVEQHRGPRQRPQHVHAQPDPRCGRPRVRLLLAPHQDVTRRPRRRESPAVGSRLSSASSPMSQEVSDQGARTPVAGARSQLDQRPRGSGLGVTRSPRARLPGCRPTFSCGRLAATRCALDRGSSGPRPAASPPAALPHQAPTR